MKLHTLIIACFTFFVVSVGGALASPSSNPSPTVSQATRAIKHEWRRTQRPVTVYGCHREHRGVTRCMSKVVFTATMNFNGIQHGTATMFTKETVRRHNGRLTVRDQNSASTTILRFPG